MIGFGRIGQIASQFLLTRGCDISIIDSDVEVIDAARVRLQCVDKPEDGTRIVELMKAEFPLVPVLARASDRRQSMDLIRAGADFEIRETFESAIVLGAKALETLGVAPAEVAEISARVRNRDRERLSSSSQAGFRRAGRSSAATPGLDHYPSFKSGLSTCISSSTKGVLVSQST